MDKKGVRKRFAPLLLTLFIFVIDQLSKWWVVSTIQEGTIKYSFLADFLWICHVRNSAIGFSIGHSLPEMAKRILFVALPVLVVVLLIFYLLKGDDLKPFQRWMVGGIIGGGLGNLFDRIFRVAWVVDFISVKVYGLFGFERWPTFNLADASIVVFASLLVISFFVYGIKEGKKDEMV
jgi:signal peptidase II